MASRGGANLLRARSEFDDKVSGKLDKLRDKFDQLGKSQGAKAVLQGVGMGAGIKAWDLLERGIGAVTDKIGEAIQSGIAEEASIARLNTALKANVTSWGGNAEAIDKILAQRIALGFSDDAQRDSLGQLVVATKSVTKALDVQRVAMDLARMKGISLGEASDALTKVEAGSYRILKTLGIVVRDNATQQEVLTAVQKAAEGQAESYAGTVEGKLTVAQVKYGEAMDRIGTTTLPLVATAADGVAKAFDVLQAIQDHGISVAGKLSGATDIAAESALHVTRNLREVATIPPPFKRVEKSARDAAEELAKFKDSIEDAVDAVIGAAFEPEQLALKLTATKRELAANQKELDTLTSKGKKTAGDWDRIVELRTRVSEGKEETIKLSTKLAGLDGLTTDEITAQIARLGDKTKWAADQVARLNGLLGGTNAGGNSRGGTNDRGRASGGPVFPGQSYTVGERGTETLVMGQSGGYVIPHGRGGGSSSGGGAPVTIQLQLDGRVVAEVVDRQLYYKSARAPQSRYAG